MVIQRKYHGVQCCCGLGQPNGRESAETADFQYRTQWRRIEPLAKIGAVPFQDRDKAQANLDGARAGLDDANAKLAKARANLGARDANNPDIRAAVAKLDDAELELSWATVTAPVNGYVTDLDVSLGSYATAGQPMLALVDTALTLRDATG